jgi:thioredoxin-like negative regulator of GroEL
MQETTISANSKGRALYARIQLWQLISSRKIVKCYIDLGKLDAAREVLEMMSSARKLHALSRYLRYSLALRRGIEEEGTASITIGIDHLANNPSVQSALASLANQHDGRNRLLFAAASEALQYGGRTQGALLLQRILDKYNDNLPPEIDAFALLR